MQDAIGYTQVRYDFSTMKRVCVFCGSNMGTRPEYAEVARAMGTALVGRGFGLVYGGGRVGLMGTIADAVLEGGGEAIGVIPESLKAKELEHRGLSELHVVASMHQRKALMAELSDAFVAMPGGFGTFEEFCEILTWAQLGFHTKPMGLLNAVGFYDPMLAMFDQATAEGFVRPHHRSMVQVANNPDDLLDLFLAYRPPVVEKWIGRSQT